MTANNFPFIVSNGPKLNNDPDVRAVIRKQAMRDVGKARRKRQKESRASSSTTTPVGDNSTTIPIRKVASTDSGEESSPTESSDSSRTMDEDVYDEEVPRQTEISTWKRLPADSFSFSTISLLSSYESARSQFQVDVTDLSMLTYFHVGRSTMQFLAADRKYLACLMGYKQWQALSYLQFIPSRYGSSDCVTAATNCVLGKVKSILEPQSSLRKVTLLNLYSKALRTLQDAISDESCMDADVLCATQLLSLHELLDPSRDVAWSRHVDGCSRLVKSRTPERFKTEFEKALFAAHVGPVLVEALTQTRPCYLEQPEWTELYKSLIQDSKFLHERSALTINVRSLIFPIPALWHDANEVILGDGLFEDYALDALKTRCLKSQQDLLNWMEEYKNHCVQLSLTSPPPQELALRRELFGTSLEGLLIVKRLLASVSDQDRQRLETETQALAHLLLDLQQQDSPKYSWLFSGHEVGMAWATIQTKDQWEGHFEYESDYERRIAIRKRYYTWSMILRESEKHP